VAPSWPGTTTRPGADPGRGPALAAAARRLALSDLVGRLAGGLAESAGRYKGAAGLATGPLRQALERLGRAAQAQRAEIASLARALGSPTPATQPDPLGGPPAWGVILGEAFQQERSLGRLAGDLGTLASDPPLKALAARLATEASERAEEVRGLYLRYS
jgi:hypothetical protein